jgi:hypothetical protein
MDTNLGFDPGWPDELKELWGNWYCETVRVESLENYAKHCSPDAFEATMKELEKAMEKVMKYGQALTARRVKYASEHGASPSVNPITRARGEDFDGME